MKPQELSILYQDDALAVCIKPAGVDSQAGMCALLEARTGKAAYCVHRLDREVGGVMVYALSSASAAALGRAITAGALEKEYLAVCEGAPTPQKGEMRDLLYHDASKNKSYVVKRPRRGVREALLDYALLEARDGLALVRIRLRTGRSHQIRVQFASRAHPLAGDARYGAKTRGGIALWACSLSFPHPDSGDRLRFSALPPETDLWTRFELRGRENA